MEVGLIGLSTDDDLLLLEVLEALTRLKLSNRGRGRNGKESGGGELEEEKEKEEEEEKNEIPGKLQRSQKWRRGYWQSPSAPP